MNVSPPRFRFTVNGTPAEILGSPARRLSDVLREDLRLSGTKVGCDAGDCGACTVLLDGAPFCACMLPLAQASGRKITTIEGLGAARLNGLQNAFLRHGAAQCGICTPGMVMTAAALLDGKPRPTPAEAEEALGGVLCRCTGYRKIIDAVCDAWQTPEPEVLPDAGRAVGAPIERLDGRAKVAGFDAFGADDWPDGALAVRVVRSPYHHADFSFGDLAAWRESNAGVVAVFTADDIPGRNCFGVIPPFADQPALARAPARLRGEAVALVAGEPDALALLDLSGFPIVWEERPFVLTTEAAKAESAPQLHEERPGNLLTQGFVERGNPEAALAVAAHRAEGCIETAYVEHAYIEPEAGTAWMEGDRLVVRACTQAPGMDRSDNRSRFWACRKSGCGSFRPQPAAASAPSSTSRCSRWWAWWR